MLPWRCNTICQLLLLIKQEAWFDILQGFVEHLEMEIEGDMPTQGITHTGIHT